MNRKRLLYLAMIIGLGILSAILLMLSRGQDLDRLAEARQLVGTMLNVQTKTQRLILASQLRAESQNSAITNECIRLSDLATQLTTLMTGTSKSVANETRPVIDLVVSQRFKEEQTVNSFLTTSTAYRNSLAYIEATSQRLSDLAMLNNHRDLAYDVLLLRSQINRFLVASSLHETREDDFIAQLFALRKHSLSPEMAEQLLLFESHLRKALELEPRVYSQLESVLASPLADIMTLADEAIANSIAAETSRVQFATKGFASLVAALIAFVASLLWELSKQTRLLYLANATLEEKVLAKVKEIREYEQAMVQSQKLESIGQLAAGIAHEINTPMQCISSNIEFIKSCSSRLVLVVDSLRNQLFTEDLKSREDRQEEMRRLFTEHRFDYAYSQTPAAIDEAAEATSRVIDIVRAMKAMSHPGTKEKVSTDINELVRSAVTVSKSRWKNSAELVLELDSALPEVAGLPAELSQVLLNLVVNAADAITEKHGKASNSMGCITVKTSPDGDGVRIDVLDDGCGIPDANKLKVFDPFFTTKDVGKGTGQGLAITYDIIVSKHGGTISVNSAVGNGTTFSVWLPCHSQHIDANTDDETSLGFGTIGAA